MHTPATTTKYKKHRVPVEILSHAVWLYFRFCLSFRAVEALLLERGMGVTDEALGKGCRKCGHHSANPRRRRRQRPGAKWQRDEGFLRIKGTPPYRWRGVEQDGNELDSLGQRRREKQAAKQF